MGVLGYSFLEENSDKVKPVSINGIAPTEETISSLDHPGARKLYIYVKGEHLQAKPALRDFVQSYAQLWKKGGPLEQRGLVPLSAEDEAASTAQATALKPLDAATLK